MNKIKISNGRYIVGLDRGRGEGGGGGEGGRQIDVRPLLNGNNLEISENLNAENCLWRTV